jgi:hypothetical protein
MVKGWLDEMTVPRGKGVWIWIGEPIVIFVLRLTLAGVVPVIV